MFRIIIYYSLFILSSPNFFRRTNNENIFPFCYSLNSLNPKNNEDIQIFCSGDKCFGILNSNKTNLYSNVTVLCNQLYCIITKNTNDLSVKGECYNIQECENCFEIILSCIKNNCIGGTIQYIYENNNNNESNESNEDNKNQNESNNKDNNEEEKLPQNFLNNTIIIIQCLKNICNRREIKDRKDIINKDNDNELYCENKKCCFEINDGETDEEIKEKEKENEKIKEKEKEKENENEKENEKEKEKEKENEKKRKKIIIIIIVSCSWLFFAIICIILICNCEVLSFHCQCEITSILIIFFIIFFSPFFFIYALIIIFCKNERYSNNSKSSLRRKITGDKLEFCRDERDSESSSSYLRRKITSNKLKENEKKDLSENERKFFVNNDELKGIKKTNKKKLDEIKDIEEKKRIIIQTHSEFCEIEKIDNEFYLVNKEEIKIAFLLCQSLKLFSKDIIIYTFNIAQVNLFKERFKNDLSFIKIVLLNENCTNFTLADYIIISYIESEISENSKKKYYNFKANLYTRNFYTKKFSNDILEKYTRKKLYLICNDEYLKKSIEDTNIKSNINIEESIKGKIRGSNLESPIAKAYKEIQAPIINREYISNDYNICFLIDNTGSMGSWINVIKDICKKLFEEIVKKFNKYKFYFGCVLYADKISVVTDKNYIINFTQNVEVFKSKLEEIELQNGGDVAEDWATAFQIALEELNWGSGIKLIFHIADAPHHGKIFNIDKKDDKFLDEEDDINGKNLIKLIKRCSDRNIKITGISIDNVCSFKVFKEEYEKVNGAKYEIIEVNGMELIKGNEYINKKVIDIIEKSVNENKADENEINIIYD